MIKTEALKELLKINLDKLIKNTRIEDLTIKFVNDNEIAILNKDKKIVFKDSLNNYDLDFDSQKKFILNVAESVTSIAMILEDLRPKDEKFLDAYFNLNNNNYIEVLGHGAMYISSRSLVYISFVDLDLFFEDSKYEICKDFKNIMLDTLIDKIKDKIDGDKIKVIVYSNKKCDGIYFYIDKVMNEDALCIGYIDDLSKLKELKVLKNSKIPNGLNTVKYKNITLYYSITTNEEVYKATKTIEEYADEYESLFVKIWKNLGGNQKNS